MGRKTARTKAPSATPEERAARALAWQIKRFKEQLRKLPEWPEVDIEEC